MSDLKEWLTEGLHHCGMCGQQAVEINSRGQWICTACLNEVRPDFMSALRMEAHARIEELEAENKRLIGDAKKFAAKLAIKGGDENYPTLWAYEQACASLDKHRARAEAAEAKLATATEALKRIAYHVPSFDYAGRDEYGHIRTDFPGSPYDRGKADACKRLSGIAETAIRALKSTNQT